LAEPAVLRYGVKALLDPGAPLHVPIRVDPKLWSFLLRFAAHCTARTWRRTMAALVPLNVAAHDAYDQIEADPGMTAHLDRGPILAAFREDEHADGLVREFEQIREAGLELEFGDVTGAEIQELAPVVSGQVTRAIRIDGQRFMNPGQ